jgi:hypothetical protein
MGHKQSKMKGHRTKIQTKTNRDTTNTATGPNRLAPPKLTRNVTLISHLKHGVKNNPRLQQILHRNRCVELIARLRRNNSKYGFDTTHAQSIVANCSRTDETDALSPTQKTKTMELKRSQWRFRTRTTSVRQSNPETKRNGAPPRRRNQTFTPDGG